MLGFCLKRSRYIVMDFDGRFRMVQTIKRASADHRWKVESKRSFLSRRFGVNVNRIHLFERKSGRSRSRSTTIGEADPNRHPIPRRLHLKQCAFMAHGTSDLCPGFRALVNCGGAEGHTEGLSNSCRGRTQEDKGRESPFSRSGYSQIGETLTRRALKREFGLQLTEWKTMPRRQTFTKSCTTCVFD